MFSFKDLVTEYQTGEVFYVTEHGGYYDANRGGRWIDGLKETTRLRVSAIVPLSNEELKFGGGGTYSVEDRKLYCYKRLDKGTLIKNICHDKSERLYKLTEELNYSDFDGYGDGLHIYFLKRTDKDA